MPRKRTVADNGKISKSQAVRDYLDQHPRAKPKEIGPAVKAAHGLDVKPQIISMIKSNWRKARRGRGRPPGARGKAGRPQAADARITVDDLISAKKLVGQLGGVERAQAVLAALARLT
jgi:hypothetical protein